MYFKNFEPDKKIICFDDKKYAKPTSYNNFLGLLNIKQEYSRLSRRKIEKYHYMVVT